MTMQRLRKSQWTGFCERLTSELTGKRAEIEVASLDIGIQLEARWLPILGVFYDPSDDIMEILLDGVDHIISHPRELYVEFGSGGIENIGIRDEASAWQIVLLRNPLMLPAPDRLG